jgi:hypothetical protein
MGRELRIFIAAIGFISMIGCYVEHDIPETPVYDGKGPVVTATPIPVPTVAITGYPVPY